mmetsp:Transcript_84212/g.234904  ORF Transcript_84212/g.234904 Transcript_84212/m.234904 type:complete len:375 (-) Transcript_84212:60-1184(-)
MSSLASKTTEERLARLVKARDRCIVLNEASHSGWVNGCEDAFNELRVSVVHMRKEMETLDALEDKRSVWHFICKFSRTRPFMHERCSEVLKILMLRAEWMREFFDDPSCDIKDLPEKVHDEFKQKGEELVPDRFRGDGEKPGKENSAKPEQGAKPKNPADERAKDAAVRPEDVPGVPVEQRPAGMSVVVQRCARAKVLVNASAATWDEIGRGLIVSVSFAHGAKEEKVRGAAKFLLTANLAAAGAREPAASVVALSKEGSELGIAVLPQQSLSSEFGRRDLSLHYTCQLQENDASSLYKVFMDALRSFAGELVGADDAAATKRGSWNPFAPAARTSGSRQAGAPRVPKIICCEFGSQPNVEVSSDGPFMHSFQF